MKLSSIRNLRERGDRIADFALKNGAPAAIPDYERFAAAVESARGPVLPQIAADGATLTEVINAVRSIGWDGMEKDERARRKAVKRARKLRGKRERLAERLGGVPSDYLRHAEVV